MSRPFSSKLRSIPRWIAVLPLLMALACNGAGAAVVIPNPVVDEPMAKSKGQASMVVAGGCFWGIQAVFQHVKGVQSATAGYAGGEANTAHYEMVGTGTTGHAESVKIVYDPSKISYGQLLKVFFSVAHNPTELNRQGPDVGEEYRSVIFHANEDQKRIAQAYIDQLNQAKIFSKSIVTQVVPLKGFYPAEAYHQDYASHHPDDPYIRFNDLPKLEHLREQLPELYVGK
ncbi:MAG TPA: peptide-methionine (S)-S-oxide reductase MsrA [Candidatus Angelobacter sp.]|nr:peptide-methionine (S)-S-oxide reductase MsrA [Candidatus Angelobacter sp.]